MHFCRIPARHMHSCGQSSISVSGFLCFRPLRNFPLPLSKLQQIRPLREKPAFRRMIPDKLLFAEPLRHIEKRLIDGYLLHSVRIGLQNCNKPAGVLPVYREIRLLQHQIRAFPQGAHDRFSGGNAILLRRNGPCSDHTVPPAHIPANRGGDRAQIHRIRILLKPLQRRPGQKGRIDIHMKNNPVFRILPALISRLPERTACFSQPPVLLHHCPAFPICFPAFRDYFAALLLSFPTFGALCFRPRELNCRLSHGFAAFLPSGSFPSGRDA